MMFASCSPLASEKNKTTASEDGVLVQGGAGTHTRGWSLRLWRGSDIEMEGVGTPAQAPARAPVLRSATVYL